MEPAFVYESRHSIFWSQQLRLFLILHIVNWWKTVYIYEYIT